MPNCSIPMSECVSIVRISQIHAYLHRLSLHIIVLLAISFPWFINVLCIVCVCVCAGCIIYLEFHHHIFPFFHLNDVNPPLHINSCVCVCLCMCIENAKSVVDYLFFVLATFSIHFSSINFISFIGHMGALASARARTFIHSFIILIAALWNGCIVAQLVAENFHFDSLNTVPFNTHRLQQFYTNTHSPAKFYPIIFCYLSPPHSLARLVCSFEKKLVELGFWDFLLFFACYLVW